MHRADVIAAIKKRGTSMAELSRNAGLSETAVRVSLDRPFLRAEEVVIGFLKLPPKKIWPDRYDAEGNRTVRLGRRATRNRAGNNSDNRRSRGQ